MRTQIKEYDEVKIMNMKSTVVAASLLSMLSFGAFAATSVNAEQAQNLQPMGTVSVSQIGSAPMDMHQMLNEKAEAKGASSYRIVEARSGDAWHATAELYK
ncbi:uncharacterized protein DUF1471 [Buttiauxella sp. BIGb0552]|jgi:hypothetical protein|nr:uncharacterized protein DUF1471 [Buttiauxella sp. BIGb0552]